MPSAGETSKVTPVGNGPSHFTIREEETASGNFTKYAYVANRNSESVSKIDLHTMEPVLSDFDGKFDKGVQPLFVYQLWEGRTSSSQNDKLWIIINCTDKKFEVSKNVFWIAEI